TNENGEKVKGDIVIYTILAKNGPEHYTYDPADKSAGNEMHVRDFTFDSDTGEIRYILPRACRIRLRAGLKESVLLKTIFDWQAQEAGEHKFIWDGKDESGNFALLKHPQLNLNLSAYTLPDNCIIINNGSRSIPRESGLLSRESDKVNKENKYFHFPHNQIDCHEPEFAVSFPEAKNNADNLSILQGKVPVRVEISPKDKAYIINKRFEAMFFVDGIFLFEEEAGSSPLTFYWDTANLNQGEHLFSVNIMSYDDHVGTKTQKVMIEDKK
ncbi:MAG: hypothetical protein KKD05_02685, partial [Candidatus Omnitrophica bacterium]|nr:hypothetical protein [Candidatus Omnitrophota bacterium]